MKFYRVVILLLFYMVFVVHLSGLNRVVIRFHNTFIESC